MSVNKYLPHVFVLPEDDANRQLANGFVLDLSNRQIQVLPEVGGWIQVRDRFAEDHTFGMIKYPDRFMVLLVDFDGDPNRLRDIKAVVPEQLGERVFIVGAWREPEALRQSGLGSYEQIGRALARDCREGNEHTWGHAMLQHNRDELQRMRQRLCEILF